MINKNVFKLTNHSSGCCAQKSSATKQLKFKYLFTIAFLMLISFQVKAQTVVDIELGGVSFDNGFVTVVSEPYTLSACSETLGDTPWLNQSSHYIEANFTSKVTSATYVFFGADANQDRMSVLINGATYTITPANMTCPSVYSCPSLPDCGSPTYPGDDVRGAGPNAYELTVSGIPGGISSFRVSQVSNSSGHGAGKIIYGPLVCEAGASAPAF